MVINERVSRARSEYRTKLCGRIQELSALLSQAPSDPEALAAAQRLAHRIYGSAGTFGFAEVGDAARSIDKSLLELQSGARLPSAELWDDLSALLARANAELCGA